MNIWIFIWAVVAVFVLGISFWSMQVLFKQKKAWKKLAKSLNLSYQEQAFLASPVVDGLYNKYHITLYSEEQATQDSARRQFRTVLVIAFQEGFPTGGAIASAGRRPFVEGLRIEEGHKPEFKGWNGNIVFHTQDNDIMSSFMDERRYQALHRIMNLTGKEAIFIFDDKEAYYRLETADPLTDPESVEKMIKKILKECDVLRPTAEDQKLCKPKKSNKKDEETSAEEEAED